MSKGRDKTGWSVALSGLLLGLVMPGWGLAAGVCLAEQAQKANTKKDANETKKLAPGGTQVKGAGAHPGEATNEVAGLKVDAPPLAGIEIDRVVGVVNGELILESDVDEERRFAAFQPFGDPKTAFARDKALERLVDRTLILEQAKLQQEAPVTKAELKLELDKLRKDIPACSRFQCETEAGWKKFVETQGFTEAELGERWRERMEVLRYIEQRFRMGIRITDGEIKSYYDKTMMPEYVKEKVTPPKLEAVSDRIQEVLLQQQVGNLLEGWLKSLRAQGSVRMAPGLMPETMPTGGAR